MHFKALDQRWMQMKMSRVLIGLSVVTLTACNRNLFHVCRNGPSVALAVQVMDSVTSAAVPASTLTGYLLDTTDNVTKLTLLPFASTNNTTFLEYLGQRKGTYDAVINAPGYKEWRKSGVTLTLSADSCFIVPGDLVAKLQKTTTP